MIVKTLFFDKNAGCRAIIGGCGRTATSNGTAVTSSGDTVTSNGAAVATNGTTVATNGTTVGIKIWTKDQNFIKKHSFIENNTLPRPFGA